jgi:DNA-binding NarL/FixJ family response regulator
LQKHILITDDSPIIRKTLRKFLEKENDWVVVGEAANGKEALEKTRELKPDLVVLDLAMPQMNGIQAARELKRLSPDTPLLMFTNVDSARLADMATAIGVNAVIPKSQPRLLVERIHALLEPVA